MVELYTRRALIVKDWGAEKNASRLPGVKLFTDRKTPGIISLMRNNTGHSFSGAGDGNRTHVTSLEGWGSTIELHPPKDGLSIRPLRKSGAVDEIRTRDIHLGKVALYH